MKHYKDINNGVYAYESDGSQDAFINPGLIAITNAEADTLRTHIPMPEELVLAAEQQAQHDLKAATKMDAIFTDIASDTIAQLVHKIEVQFPNPTFTNAQQKILKVCLVAAALSLRSQ